MEEPGSDEPLTAATMAGRLADGSATSAGLVRRSLEKIDRLDSYFGAILAPTPDALAQAEASDEHRRRHGPRSPLEGVPVVLKDNIDLTGMATTAGSLALASSVPPADAHLVTRLKQAGAVLVAKANLSELANFLTAGMPSGYSSLGGQVLNPYDTSVTPSGSSSGSAAAVALGLAPIAVGTETDGSIISPAAHQSVVGIKPTLGLVSRHGIFPIAPSQDTAGPMAATVLDAALLLAWMSGTDASDAATGPADAVAEGLRRSAPEPAELGSATIVVVSETGPDGVPRPGLSDPLLGLLRQQGPRLAEAGLDALSQDDEMVVLHYEFAPAVTAYFKGWPPGAPRSLADIRDWNSSHSDVALKFGQSHVEAALSVDHRTEEDRYRQARRRDRDQVVAALEAALGQADCLLFRSDGGATWAARSGWPSVTVPVGYSVRSRRPLAVTLVGRPWAESRLVSIAAGLEQAIGRRRPPWEINPALFVRLSRPFGR